MSNHDDHENLLMSVTLDEMRETQHPTATITAIGDEILEALDIEVAGLPERSVPSFLQLIGDLITEAGDGMERERASNGTQ